jgi:hypothetical protein
MDRPILALSTRMGGSVTARVLIAPQKLPTMSTTQDKKTGLKKKIAINNFRITRVTIRQLKPLSSAKIGKMTEIGHFCIVGFKYLNVLSAGG